MESTDVDPVGDHRNLGLAFRRQQIARRRVDPIGPAQQGAPPAVDRPHERQPVEAVPPEPGYGADGRVDFEDGRDPCPVGRPDPASAERVETVDDNIGMYHIDQPSDPGAGSPLEESRRACQCVMLPNVAVR